MPAVSVASRTVVWLLIASGEGSGVWSNLPLVSAFRVLRLPPSTEYCRLDRFVPVSIAVPMSRAVLLWLPPGIGVSRVVWGAAVSRVKLRLKVLDVLPPESVAMRRRLWMPSLRGLRLMVSSWVRLRVKLPLLPRRGVMLVNSAVGVSSKPARKLAMLLSSVTVPPIAGLEVIRSLFDVPVSLVRAAEIAGGVVSLGTKLLA